MLRAEHISVAFGGVRAVDDVSLSVADREVVGLVGPNGSGKSTFLNAVSGLVSATGSVEVGGSAVRLGRPGRIRAAGLLRTFQTPQVWPELTCLENALLAHPDQHLSRLVGAWFLRPGMLATERQRWLDGEAALRRVGLEALADTPAGELAYGQQRLLEVARVVAARPRMVLLDEPGAGLNSAETAELSALLASLREDGVSLLVVDHKIDFLDSLCDRLVVLQLGTVVAEGPPATVWNDSRVVDAYLGRSTSAAG
jgi:ABC-type branched-subunit amino acid transport system ATPase component